MPVPSQALLEPRKSPVQARSTASVDAILEATVQVLLTVGKERLTTTRVAARAGVSVGTLYQYFPNKSSLLQAALRRHFDQVTAAIERVCREERGTPLPDMAAKLASTFLAAKMAEGSTGAVLYSVSTDVDGIEIAQEVKRRTHAMICEMLRSASDRKGRDPGMIATVLQGILSGISRQLLESDRPQQQFAMFEHELLQVVRAYLQPDRRA